MPINVAHDESNESYDVEIINYLIQANRDRAKFEAEHFNAIFCHAANIELPSEITQLIKDFTDYPITAILLQDRCKHYFFQSDASEDVIKKRKKNRNILIIKKDSSYEIHYVSKQSYSYEFISIDDTADQTLKRALDEIYRTHRPNKDTIKKVN